MTRNDSIPAEDGKDTLSSSVPRAASVSKAPPSLPLLPTFSECNASPAPSHFNSSASTSRRHYFDCQEELAEEQRHEQELQQAAAQAALEAARAADEEAQVFRQQEQQNQRKGSLVALSILLRAAAVQVWDVRTLETQGKVAVGPRHWGPPLSQDKQDLPDGSSQQISCKEERKVAQREEEAWHTAEREDEHESGGNRPADCTARSTSGTRRGDLASQKGRSEGQSSLCAAEERFGIAGALREVRIQVVHGGCETRVRVGLRDMALMHEGGKGSAQRLVYRHLTLEQPLLRVCFSRVLPPLPMSLDAGPCSLYDGAAMPTLNGGQNSVGRVRGFSQPTNSASTDFSRQRLSPSTRVPASHQYLLPQPTALPADENALDWEFPAGAPPLRREGRPSENLCSGARRQSKNSPTFPSPSVPSPQGSSELRLTLQHFVCVYAVDAVQDAALLMTEVRQGLKSGGPSLFSPDFTLADRRGGRSQVDEAAHVKGRGQFKEQEESRIADMKKKTDKESLEPGKEEMQEEEEFSSSPSNGEMRDDTSAQLDAEAPFSPQQESASGKPGELGIAGRRGTAAQRLLLRSRERLKALTLSTKYFIHVSAPTVVLPTKMGSVAQGAVLVLHLGDIHVSS